MLTNKGAMFGLDARIALAIFGALSVISGAALYSAIQESKATALLSDMNEVGKAWEQYYLDTGVNLPQNSADSSSQEFYRLKTQQLVENQDNVKNWKGPYLNYKVNSYNLLHPQYSQIHAVTITNEETWGDNISWPSGKCTTSKQCYISVMISGIKNDSMAQTIDQKIDNSDGNTKGKFRWWYVNDGSGYRYHLQYAPTDNPND
ncbi:MAG TPA: hypothetical protein DCL21_06095 [Alphaproteobacteria bacterium]|nr:hypothetical protein [Alphaproteobacteria bacterium]